MGNLQNIPPVALLSKNPYRQSLIGEKSKARKENKNNGMTIKQRAKRRSQRRERGQQRLNLVASMVEAWEDARKKEEKIAASTMNEQSQEKRANKKVRRNKKETIASSFDMDDL